MGEIVGKLVEEYLAGKVKVARVDRK